MNRLKAVYNYLCGTNFAYLLILGLVVKAIVSDISVATFLLSIPVLGFESYKMYLKSRKPDPIALDAEVRKELDQIKSKINANAFEKNISPNAPAKRYF